MTADRTEWRCPETGRTCTSEDCDEACRVMLNGLTEAETLATASVAGLTTAPAEGDEPLFLLHCGQIDSGGEQDEWETQADSYKRVEAFCRLHPGQTVKLYPHVQPKSAEGLDDYAAGVLDGLEMAERVVETTPPGLKVNALRKVRADLGPKAQPKGTADLGVGLIERLMKLSTRLGIAHEGGVEHFGASLEDRLYAICRSTERFLDSLPGATQAPAPVADDQWRDAVDQQLILCELTVTNFATPSDAVRGLLDWHAMVAREAGNASTAPAPQASRPVYAQLVASNVAALKTLLRNMLDQEQYDSGVEGMLDQIAEGVDEAMGDAYAEGRQDQLDQDKEDFEAPAVGANDALDAARWRWLREENQRVPGPCAYAPWAGPPMFGDELDAAVDAAMAASQPPVQGTGGGNG